MFRNYLKIALRHLWRNKTFSAINILGLSIGTAGALLIIFHVKQELSYDKNFSTADRIFRVTQQGLGEDNRHWATTSFPMGTSMLQDIPEIESQVRFHRPYPYIVFSYTPGQGEAKRFEEKGGFFADSGAVDMFDLAFVRGDRKTALSEMNTIVLTEEMARKYFDKEDPLGKTLVDEMGKRPLKVTGVIQTFPFNTHLKFDYLLSMSTIRNYVDSASLAARSWNGFYTFVSLKKNVSPQQAEKRLDDFNAAYFAKAGRTRSETLGLRKLHFQPITEIHLHSKLEKEMYANGDITYVYIFSIAAFFILLIAAVNFINMSTAQAFNRMKEIGLRKVIGGTRWQLLLQFLGESLLSTVLATIIAILLFQLAIPFYNELTGKSIEFGKLLNPANVSILFIVVILIGLLSGAYPAWFVANFNPVSSLKGKKLMSVSVTRVRKGLIIFQFVVAVFMFFSTMIVFQQMRLFHRKNLGFDKEQVVAVTMYPEMWKNFSGLTSEIRKNKSIADYSIVSTLPGERFSMQSFSPLSATNQEESPSIRTMYGDERMLATLGIKVTAGRNFVNQFPDIKNPEFIINESAASVFKLNNPLGQRFVLDADTGTIVGVVKDFNFASLHSPIEPLAIEYNPYRSNYLLLKIQPDQLERTLAALKSDIGTLSPSSVFNYTFLDEKLSRLYESENRMSQVFRVFAGFALLISCLGLFGLSMYAARLRIREIGVRKVLGASVKSLVLLLSGDFTKLMLIATVIALPLAWWVMSKWLNGFAYRINISAEIFIVSAASVIILGFLTVSMQAVKAALVNPVKSLKTD